MVSNPGLDRGIISANDGKWSGSNYPLSFMQIVFCSKEHNQGAKRWAGTRSCNTGTIGAEQKKTIKDAGGRVTKLSNRHRLG